MVWESLARWWTYCKSYAVRSYCVPTSRHSLGTFVFQNFTFNYMLIDIFNMRDNKWFIEMELSDIFKQFKCILCIDVWGLQCKVDEGESLVSCAHSYACRAHMFITYKLSQHILQSGTSESLIAWMKISWTEEIKYNIFTFLKLMA